MIDKNRVQSRYVDEWNYISLNRLRKDVSRNELLQLFQKWSNEQRKKCENTFLYNDIMMLILWSLSCYFIYFL